MYGESEGGRKKHYYSELSVAIATGLLLAAVQVHLPITRFPNSCRCPERGPGHSHVHAAQCGSPDPGPPPAPTQREGDSWRLAEVGIQRGHLYCQVVLLLPVGYPAEDCVVPNIQRKSFSEIAVVC